MPADLYSLAYFSRNAIDTSTDDLNAQIAKILNVARANNAAIDVTGALLFSKGCFAQVLEGPLDAVETLFEQIECDPRHKDVTILHIKPAETRHFGDWSMAYAGDVSHAAESADLEGLFASADQIAAAQAGVDVVRVMGDLIRRTEAAKV